MGTCKEHTKTPQEKLTQAFSPEPVVHLESYFKSPYDLSVAAARTCYSSRIIRVEDVERDELSRLQRDKIAQSIYKAGHHTTIQHAHFQFALEKVSRQFLWSFLHSHPFYNSEQVSQRYVEVKPGNFCIPPLSDRARGLYLGAIELQMQGYHRLVELLKPSVEKEYKRLFPVRKLEENRWQSAIKKRCQEVARYCLPIATHAHLYHTISGLTLHRYRRLCEQFDAPYEQRLVVQKMVEEVNKIDPKFMSVAEDSIPLEDTLEYKIYESLHGAGENRDTSLFIEEFDRELGGKTSKLIDYKVNAKSTMASAVRSVMGASKEKLSDEKAIELVMDPENNRYLSDTLNLSTMSKLTRTMHHPHFTFKKKISHSADSQDQRHRMVPASRPILSSHFSADKPDYIVPALIRDVSSASDCYASTMASAWKAIEDLLNLGVSLESAMYLLPNAFPVRFEESADLLNLHHKWVHRLCYTAQEEIWNACRQEVAQVVKIFPEIGSYIFAPCWFRSKSDIRPVCPEGDRFCGVAVWKLPIEEYDRII